MKTFGTIMCVVLVLALLAGGCFALYKATNSFKDWNPSNWGENIKPNEQVEQQSNKVQLKSSKYGTFDIDKTNNIKLCLNAYADRIIFPDNTNLSFISKYLSYDPSHPIYPEFFITERSHPYFITNDNYKQILDNYEIYQDSNSHSALLIKNNIIKYKDISIANSILTLNDLVFFKTSNVNINEKKLNTSNDGLSCSNLKDEFSSLNVFVKQDYVVVGSSNGSQSTNALTFITSDIGQVLTEDVFNEIKAEYKANGIEFPFK